MSSLRYPSVLARPACAEHRVENGEELAHTGRQRHSFGFPRCTEPVIECPDDRTALGGHHGRFKSCRVHHQQNCSVHTFNPRVLGSSRKSIATCVFSTIPHRVQKTVSSS